MDIKQFISILFVLTSLVSVNAEFQPVVELTSCLQGKVTLTVHGAIDGGIIYIQDRGPDCRHDTQHVEAQVEFDFEECNIQWGQTFKVVIQKKSLYQTWEDKQIPVTCYPDIDDIDIGGDIRHSELYDQPGINRTTRPRATMLLLRNDENVAGQVISLSDNITMVIQLVPEFKDDFDINAKACFADHIQIIKDSCSMDREMFPDLTYVRQGKLEAKFRAFKPTDLRGGTVTVSFRCTLSAHIGNHTVQKCNKLQEVKDDINLEARERRADTTDIDIEYMEDMHVTATVDILEDDNEMQAMSQLTEAGSCPCVRDGTFIGVTIFFIICLMISGTTIIWLKRKLKQEGKLCRRLTKDEVQHLVQLTNRNDITYKMDTEFTNSRTNNATSFSTRMP